MKYSHWERDRDERRGAGVLVSLSTSIKPRVVCLFYSLTTKQIFMSPNLKQFPKSLHSLSRSPTFIFHTSISTKFETKSSTISDDKPYIYLLCSANFEYRMVRIAKYIKNHQTLVFDNFNILDFKYLICYYEMLILFY